MKRETFINLAHFGFGILAGIGILGALVIHWNNNTKSLTDLEYANYRTLDYKIKVIDAYTNYYNACEAYLDEISEYEDIASGSDTHCEYLDSREVLDSLINLERNN